MITVSLRFDEKTKKELDELCDELGMNLTTFFMIYAKKHYVKEKFLLNYHYQRIHFMPKVILKE